MTKIDNTKYGDYPLQPLEWKKHVGVSYMDVINSAPS